MCNPMLAMVAITAISAGVTYTQTEQNAENQQKAINDNFALAASAAQDNYHQTDAAAQQQMSDRALEAQKEQSRLKVIAGESGALGGLSADRVMNESKFNANADIATIENNRSNANLQTEREAKAGRVNAAGQLASVQRGSLAGAGLQIAGAYAAGSATEANLNRMNQSKVAQ
jgi:hypothetical protein